MIYRTISFKYEQNKTIFRLFRNKIDLNIDLNSWHAFAVHYWYNISNCKWTYNVWYISILFLLWYCTTTIYTHITGSSDLSNVTNYLINVSLKQSTFSTRTPYLIRWILIFIAWYHCRANLLTIRNNIDHHIKMFFLTSKKWNKSSNLGWYFKSEANVLGMQDSTTDACLFWAK